MNTISSQNIYEILKKLKENKDFFDIPEIQNAITRFEDSISCVITNPEKLNPSLEYNLQLIISSLVDILKNKNKDLRKSQIASLISIMDHIISGKTKGLIKLPTGAGKTRLFTEIVTGINLPTLILVPKINLKGQTSEYFEGDNVFNIGENGTVLQNTRQILKTISENNIPNPIIIVTYQSFIILKKYKGLFEEFSKLIKVVIRDEAHRSLGDKTEEALDEMHSYSDVPSDILQKQDEDILGTDVLYSNEKLELLFTATPNLLNKSVRDNYELIYGLNLQDLVEELILHMPKFIQVSEASIHIGDLNIGERVLNDFATKFINEKGKYTYVEITDKYLELKQQNNGYFPAVGFCRDIAHAEFIKKYLEERGLRAIRVTSGNKDYDKGVDEDGAKKMIEANKVDVVITVTKVSEGWDFPTLRCALNFAPILSEAKYIQGIGRVLRIFDFEEDQKENERNGILPKDFAYIIEPKIWNISNWTGNGDDEGDGNGGGEGRGKENITKISGISHLIDSGEFDINYLRDLYGVLDEYTEVITKEEVLEYFKTTNLFEDWLLLGQTDILEIEFKGKKIKNLAKLSGWSNPNNVSLDRISGFQQFIAWVFQRELEIVTQEDILDFFKTTKTFEEWGKLKARDVVKIEFKSKKLKNLVTLSGWENSNKATLLTPSGFQEFIAWIFGKEEKKSEVITKEEVIKFFKEKTFEEWIKLKTKDIRKIEFKGKKLISLVTLTGWENFNKVELFTPSGFQQFIAWVFQRELEIVTQEDILNFFKTTKTFEEWIKLTQKDILKIEFKDKKLYSLVTLTGWENFHKVDLLTPSGFQEFIAWIFDKKLEIITKEEVFIFFKTTHNFDEWITLTKKEIFKIEFKDKKINSLVTLTGWENPNKVNLLTPSGFQEFIAWAFEKKLEIITKEEVFIFLKTTHNFDEWITLTHKDILKIKFKGKKINSLVAITRWDNPNKVNLQSLYGFQEFIAWIFNKENPNKKV